MKKLAVFSHVNFSQKMTNFTLRTENYSEKFSILSTKINPEKLKLLQKNVFSQFFFKMQNFRFLLSKKFFVQKMIKTVFARIFLQKMYTKYYGLFKKIFHPKNEKIIIFLHKNIFHPKNEKILFLHTNFFKEINEKF